MWFGVTIERTVSISRYVYRQEDDGCISAECTGWVYVAFLLVESLMPKFRAEF